MIVNLSELAELTGCSIPTVKHWVRTGMPVIERGDKGREWRIDVDAALAWREARDAGAETSSAKEDIDAARARKLAAEAEIAEIELALKRGDAISLADAGRAWAALVTAFRARMLAIPTRLAPQLVAETDLVTSRNLIEAALFEALDELAAYDPGDLHHPDRGPGGAADDPAGDGEAVPAPAEAAGQRMG